MARKYHARELRRIYLREWIKHLGLKQVEVARRMETDKANITRWIKEPWRVDMDVLSGIADALRLPNTGALFEDPERYLAERDFLDAARKVKSLP